MTGDDADETLSIVRRTGPVVMSAAMSLSGKVGTALRRAVGMMIADKNMVDLQLFCFALNICLDLSRHCQATLVTMDRVRKFALAQRPASLAATRTILAIVRLTLAMEARIIAYMPFRSREEADEVAAQMNLAFNEASEVAADELDAATYTAIIALHGAVVSYLADRARLLPRIIHYSYQTTLPSLRMAQREYADPLRHRELINENRVVHPAFMPREGKMLAV